MEMLRELVPMATSIALLVNPTNPNTETVTKDMQAAARILGLQLHIVKASADGDLETAFANLIRLPAGGLVIAPDPFFGSRIEQLAALAARHAMPAIYRRDFAAAGGLMGLTGPFAEQWRVVGTYTGRILKGEKPAQLPVQQSTKVELIINLKTAKALGISVPLTLRGRADEVIE